MDENEISKLVLDECFAIHAELGPGLLESVYEVVLAKALETRNLRVERQSPVPILFRGLQFDEGFRADLIIEGKLLVELKSVEALRPVHGKQTLTYHRLTGLKSGLLINFGEALLKDGIKRVANGL